MSWKRETWMNSYSSRHRKWTHAVHVDMGVMMTSWWGCGWDDVTHTWWMRVYIKPPRCEVREKSSRPPAGAADAYLLRRDRRCDPRPRSCLSAEIKGKLRDSHARNVVAVKRRICLQSHVRTDTLTNKTGLKSSFYTNTVLRKCWVVNLSASIANPALTLAGCHLWVWPVQLFIIQ